MRVAFRTLGCKLNQLESESMAERFDAAGSSIVPFDGDSDIYVLNTCTVTGKAEQKARRCIRQALSGRPDSVVIVTGCYAQMEPAAISALDERAIVVPGDEKANVMELASWLSEHWQGHGRLLEAVAEWRHGNISGAAPDRFAFHPDRFAFHSRPGLKIQDGCDNRCAYCRVCFARGASVSLPAGEVLARVQSLEAAGKAEVVLTGVNLSQYRDGSMRFPGLLRALHDGTSRIAFRLSSYEPERVDEAFLAAFALPRVRPHAHLALQSGADAVLRRMARPYGADRVRAAVAALRAAREDPFIGVDLIAGFPGETDGEFEATLALCRELDFAWIHAFPFSARPGTKAWDMKPKVPERIAGERVALLTAQAHAGKAAYVARQAGRTLPLVLERSAADRAEPIGTPLRFGTSGNYLKLAVSGVPDHLRAGSEILVRVLGPAVTGIPGAPGFPSVSGATDDTADHEDQELGGCEGRAVFTAIA